MSDDVTSVLIVDDNEVDRYLMKRCLNRVSPPPLVYEVESAARGLTFFEERSILDTGSGEHYSRDVNLPAVVFLDINMPAMNGLDFLDEFARLKERAPTINSIVIMCSTARRQEEVDRAMAHDFVKGYFAKGDVDGSVLSTIIERYGLRPNETDAESGDAVQPVIGQPFSDESESSLAARQ